jgi:hypothetical protein
MMNTTDSTPQSTISKPADEYRFEAHATIEPGETRGRVGGGHVQLVRLVLSDGGSYEREDGTIVNPPDVVCTMSPGDARRYVTQLEAAIEQAERQST